MNHLPNESRYFQNHEILVSCAFSSRYIWQQSKCNCIFHALLFLYCVDPFHNFCLTIAGDMRVVLCKSKYIFTESFQLSFGSKTHGLRRVEQMKMCYIF